MVFDGILATTAKECAMLAFLYEKDIVHIDEGSVEIHLRKTRYSEIMQPETSCNVTFFEKAHKKLKRITATADDYVSTQVPSDVLSWDDTMRAMPQWADPTRSYVFHRDDPDILPENRGQVLIQRVTEKAPSYMHAPVVLQHYLISKHSKSKIDPLILDMAKYIRDTFTTKQLKRHFLYDEGIPSRFLMRMLLQRNSAARIVDFQEITADFLKVHGPAMLSGFPLCDDFGSDDGDLIYDLGDCDASTDHALPPIPAPGPARCDAEEGGPCTLNHAMLIIGVRGEGAARRFLVQNWWRHHQFLELSLGYLESLWPRGWDISVHVVLTPQLEFPAGFAQAAAPYAETGLIDAREPEHLIGPHSMWM
jgi:hypothetical protein